MGVVSPKAVGRLGPAVDRLGGAHTSYCHLPAHSESLFQIQNFVALITLPAGRSLCQLLPSARASPVAAEQVQTPFLRHVQPATSQAMHVCKCALRYYVAAQHFHTPFLRHVQPAMY
jgi:hypothetical protein